MTLFFLLIAIFPTHLRGDVSLQNSCGLVAGPTTGVMKAEELSGLLNRLEISGNDGNTYRIESFYKKGNGIIEEVHFKVLNRQNDIVGEGVREVSAQGDRYYGGRIEIKKQGLGIAKQIYRLFYEYAPEGAGLTIRSSNRETNSRLGRHISALKRSHAYKKAMENGENSEAWLDAHLTKIIVAAQQRGDLTAIKWIDITSKAGWKLKGIEQDGDFFLIFFAKTP